METLAGLIHPDDVPVLEAATNDGLAGRPIEAEFRVVLPDGKVRWIMSRGQALFDAEGRATRMVGIKVDVTARKQTELQLKEQGRELAAFRPVVDGWRTVRGDRARAEPAARGDSRQCRRGPAVSSRTTRPTSSRCVKSSMPSRRITAARRPSFRRSAPSCAGTISRAPLLQLNDVVEDVIDIARGDIIGRGVSLSIRSEPRLAPIAGDRVQLQQVLLNLVLNACDAMESVPETVRRLTVVTTGGLDHRVRVTVSDTGPGVPRHLLEKRVRTLRDVEATGSRPRPRRLPVNRHRP